MKSSDNPVPSCEEQLSAVSETMVKKYRELVMEGPLSAYFTLVESGYFDAAQALTAQVKTAIAGFQDKIVEVFGESDYFKSANKSLEEIGSAIDLFKTLAAELTNRAPSVESQQKEGDEPEKAELEEVAESGTSE